MPFQVRADVPGPGELRVVVFKIERAAEAILLDVVLADHLAGDFLGLGEGRDQDGQEQADDGDDDEEFDERECSV